MQLILVAILVLINLSPRINCGIVKRDNENECQQIQESDENCTYIDHCPVALELISKTKYDPQTIQLLRSVICGSSEQRDMINCNKLKLLTLLPDYENCGLQPVKSKIVYGTTADLEDYPWIALLKYKNSTGHTNYQCHGTLLSDKYVLTAAHCLKLDDSTISRFGNLYSVVLGEYDVRNEIDCISAESKYGGDCNEPVQDILIESIKYHPNFGCNGTGNDIGLIRLQKKVNFTDFVKPICLPTKDDVLQKFEPLWVGGWGKTENRTMSTIKRKARISYLPKEECLERINFEISNSQICAGSDNGSDTCRGDSGGPLMALKKHNREHKTILIGVVSFGLKCGSRAAVYTNTTAFLSWILDTIEP